MSEIGFEPLTGQLRIAGTSYSLQIGLINGKWAVRLIKGKDIIRVFIYNNKHVKGDFPNQDIIVNWVLRTVIIPNINPHQIKKTVQFLLEQAIENKDLKRIKVPVKEAIEKKLKEVPASKLKVIKKFGWVKEEELPESNNVVKSESECLRMYKCPWCDFKILHCPKCGKNLMETT